MVNYEKIEEKRYEQSWKKLKGEIPKKIPNYRRGEPSKPTISFLKFLKQKKVKGNSLDVGCGNGRNSILFAKNGFNACGVDFSKEAIRLAKKHAKQKKADAKFKVGSVFNLPYVKDEFDVLIDHGCLHHLRKTEWKKYKKNILKVLKQKGYYMLYCFSKNSGYIPRFSPKSKKRNWTLRGMHYNHFFTVDEIEKEFEKEFEILKNYEIKKEDHPKNPLRFKAFYMRKR